MTAVQDQINALIAKVQSENTVIGSAMTLITGLQAQIKALAVPAATAVSTGVTWTSTMIDPNTAAALLSLSNAIDAGAAQLAAAVATTAPSATVVAVTVAPVVAPSTTVASS